METFSLQDQLMESVAAFLADGPKEAPGGNSPKTLAPNEDFHG